MASVVMGTRVGAHLSPQQHRAFR